MPNVLDLLWDLVERPDERTEYLQDPAGYVHARGRADLTGEDVTAALGVIRDLVPADLAAAIESRVGSSPRVMPKGDEAPFEVAIRSLSEVVASVDGYGEAGPRPDPKDISLIPSVTPPPSANAAEVPDATSPESEPGVVFDPTELEVDADSAPPGDLAEPPLQPADDPPFDAAALVVADDTDVIETDDHLDVTWDDTPEPGPERFEDNVFAFEAPRFDDDDRSAETEAGEAGPEAPEVPDEPMFKKKSNLTLPTIGVDAADWYSEDEPDSDD